ncbi:hypothetical protein V498_01764 [Pseudogymnoascus sp. VKM F-4517 (FW-2822)]|nr:hypothetical protein V498_01764 [Pseudogymnoascus sp. VKM F-4517 (FW-2822)]
MIGLPPFRPDLKAIKDISQCIEFHVQHFTVEQLETRNKELSQAGVTAHKHKDFIATPLGKVNKDLPPWSVVSLEITSLSIWAWGRSQSSLRYQSSRAVPHYRRARHHPYSRRIRADVLKVTSPNLPDVPFFQVDVNFGKRCANIDLKSVEGRKIFDELLLEADVVVDGYRPGALDKLGYGANALRELALKRGKGFVYVPALL